MTTATQNSNTATRQFAILTFVACLIVQWLAYWNSFRILPASDDFPIVNEIHRGNERGIGVFFADSIIQIGYRPLKSLAIWAAGQVAPAHPMVAVRAMNLLAAALCGLVVLLWLREMNAGKAGTIAGLAVIFLHPVWVAAIGSCDGIDTVASTALLWLGAWFVYRLRARVVPATILALLCFIVGVGFKENLFALLPLSLVIIAMFWDRTRWKRGAMLLIALSIAAGAMIVIRFYVIKSGLQAGEAMLRFGPRALIENVAIFATGLLFFGDTIWVFVHESKETLAIVGASCLIAFTVIGAGLWLGLRGKKSWVIFALLGLCCAAFPTILLYHVSEMYVPPMLVPFALLCAIAADAIRAVATPAIKSVLSILLGAGLAFSIVAIHQKVAGLRDVGDRAANMIDQILAALPPDAHDLKIAILFDEKDLPPRRTYSVFMMGDEILLVHAGVLDWPRPGKHLELVSPPLDQVADFDLGSVDVAFKWNARTQKFVRVK